jgi:threonine dehydratase
VIRIDEVRAAAERIGGLVRRTPLDPSLALSRAAGCEVLLKLENLQRTGSFKVRGAMNAVAAMSAAERARGFVTASAGNHGLGLAVAGREFGARVTVFVPASAPLTKRNRIQALQANLHLIDGSYDDAHDAASAYALDTGATYVHAFADPAVVAGQGSVGMEIVGDAPDLAAALIPVGGGGLIGGIGVALRALAPGARVIGVQSEHSSAMHASLAAGRLRPGATGATICDGLAGAVGQATLDLAAEVVDEMVLVTEPEVREAVRWLFANEGMLVEGSGAVGIAALLSGRISEPRGPLVAVLTGANIDASLAADLLAN